MLEFFKCFTVPRHRNLVEMKMNYPKRSMRTSEQRALKQKIRDRLLEEHCMTEICGQWVRCNKPRVRYKLKPTYHWIDGQYIGVYQCLMAAVASLFFLSSTPAEAQYASVSGSWDHVRVVDGHWLSPNRAAYDRPVVFKAYSPFEVRHPKIKFLVGYPRLIDDTAGWRMYARHLERQSQYDALVDGPRVVARDWRKFWAWLIAIGTIGLATVSAISYGRWRSMR